MSPVAYLVPLIGYEFKLTELFAQNKFFLNIFFKNDKRFCWAVGMWAILRNRSNCPHIHQQEQRVCG